MEPGTLQKLKTNWGWQRTEKSWLQEGNGTLPGTNHRLLSDVYVHVVCLDLGSFWITESVQRDGEPGPMSSTTERRRSKTTCWPPLSVPPTYLSVMGMLPGASSWTMMVISLFSAKHQTAWKDVKGRQNLWIAIFQWDGWVCWGISVTAGTGGQTDKPRLTLD